MGTWNGPQHRARPSKEALDSGAGHGLCHSPGLLGPPRWGEPPKGSVAGNNKG